MTNWSSVWDNQHMDEDNKDNDLVPIEKASKGRKKDQERVQKEFLERLGKVSFEFIEKNTNEEELVKKTQTRDSALGMLYYLSFKPKTEEVIEQTQALEEILHSPQYKANYKETIPGASQVQPNLWYPTSYRNYERDKSRPAATGLDDFLNIWQQKATELNQQIPTARSLSVEEDDARNILAHFFTAHISMSPATKEAADWTKEFNDLVVDTSQELGIPLEGESRPVRDARAKFVESLLPRLDILDVIKQRTLTMYIDATRSLDEKIPKDFLQTREMLKVQHQELLWILEGVKKAAQKLNDGKTERKVSRTIENSTKEPEIIDLEFK